MYAYYYYQSMNAFQCMSRKHMLRNLNYKTAKCTKLEFTDWALVYSNCNYTVDFWPSTFALNLLLNLLLFQLFSVLLIYFYMILRVSQSTWLCS